MFKREIIRELERWALKDSRKPLVIRGARQVGKTTVIKQFSEKFDNFLYLNLELKEDQKPFKDFTNIDTLIQAIFFLKNVSYSKNKRILIFIDEIQEVPEAINLLRYFYEKAPDLYIISAGSLLETLFNQNVSFPVGRVEYLVIRPVSFPEFLRANGEKEASEQLKNVPVNNFAHSKLMGLFHLYALIGGMPEIVEHYSRNKDLTSLKPVYESLIISYLDDVEKYATNLTQVQIIRHAIRASYSEAGKRIKFTGFGKSNYGSREMGEALRALEKALLVNLIYPTTSFVLPLQPDLRKSPRLHVLDTGMLNYYVGVQQDILGSKDLNSVYNGTIIEHLIGQELLATQFNVLTNLNFWVREKKSSMAEVDYLYSFESKLIPIEVKSGAEGKLKSLHLFMDHAPHNLSVRLYAGEISINESKTTSGKKFFILNLPYYLVSQIEQYLTWLENQTR